MKVIVVGAGIGGLYAIYKFSRMGLEVRCFEEDTEIGGTWLRNCYPGAQCDYDAFNFSFWFDENLRKTWKWSCRFPSQAEILQYLRHVSDTFDLRKHISFQCPVSSLHFDSSLQTWKVSTAEGTFEANIVILATGGLSSEFIPAFPGRDRFVGSVYHTSRWPRDGVDFSGKRVAVIGTGSSGIQIIPGIANEAKEVLVLQRTPPFLSVAKNCALTVEDHDLFNADFEKLRDIAFTQHPLGVTHAIHAVMTTKLTAEERKEHFDAAWAEGGFAPYSCFLDMLVSESANEQVQDLFRLKMQSLVRDPKTWESIRPSGYLIGTRRPVIDGNGYLNALNRPNVKVIDLRTTRIQEFQENGIVTSDSQVHEIDLVVMATGFDFVTGSFSKLDICAGGITLASQWEVEGPSSYFGIATHNFPNLFFVGGPFSPATWGGLFRTTEYLVDLIAQCITHMLESQFSLVQVNPIFEQKYRRSAEYTNNLTLYSKTRSYYTGANIPGKSSSLFLYLKGFPTFVRETRKAGLTGFLFQ